MVLPVMQILVSSGEQAKLNRDVWSDAYVDGYLLDSGQMEPVKLRHRGGHTREYPKKSYEVQCRDRTIHLNAEYDDPSMIRNALSFNFFEWIGVPSPHTQHCRLQMNGSNLGVYLAIEAVDQTFFTKRKLSCGALMYAGNGDANFGLINPDTQKLKQNLFEGYELVLGNREDEKQLERFIFQINALQSKSLRKYLNVHLDMDNYLRWIAGAVCTGNYDGFSQNYAIYCSVPENMYRMIPWDYEGTWGRNCFGERCSSRSVSVTGYNVLTRKILAIRPFRARYKDILHDILEHAMTVEQVKREVDRLTEAIRTDMQTDSTRKHRLSTFAGESAIILSYVKHRRQFLINQLKSL